MNPYLRHLREQLPVLGAMGKTAVLALRQRVVKPTGSGTMPGPLLRATIAPRPRPMIDDYLRHIGGEPSAYPGVVPPHLFPQWSFPLQAQSLEAIPYPIAKVLNGGCTLALNAALPDDEPLDLSVQLREIDDDGTRAVIHQRIVTGTRTNPDALVADMRAVIPLRRRTAKSAQPKYVVPDSVEEIERWRLDSAIGLEFALLTGDFNPVHWVGPYARLLGFKNPIVHGFSTMARTIESLHRARGTAPLTGFECRFTRPLTLPADVGLYIGTGADASQLFVADRPGERAYLMGSFATGTPGD